MPGEKEDYQYFGVLEVNTIKQVEMKEKIGKEYLRKMRKLLKTKLCRRNLIKEINIWAIPFVNLLWTIPKVDKGKTDQIN